MSRQAIVIVGAGGFGRALLDAIGEMPALQVLGFLDDRFAALREVDGVPLLAAAGDFAAVRESRPAVVLAIGHNPTRERLAGLAHAADLRLQTIVHPRAHVPRSARLGEGCIVMAGVTLGANVEAGMGCVLNYGAVLDHDVSLQPWSRVGVGACLGSAVKLGQRALVHDGTVVPAGQILLDDQHSPILRPVWT